VAGEFELGSGGGTWRERHGSGRRVRARQGAAARGGSGMAVAGGRQHFADKVKMLGNQEDVSQKLPKCRFHVVGKTGRWGKSIPFKARWELVRLAPLADYFQWKRLIICPKQGLR
jgi:hypothetical protein